MAKPVPDPSAREAVRILIGSPAGRAFLLYVDRLSASWDDLAADRAMALETIE